MYKKAECKTCIHMGLMRAFPNSNGRCFPQAFRRTTKTVYDNIPCIHYEEAPKVKRVIMGKGIVTFWKWDKEKGRYVPPLNHRNKRPERIRRYTTR